MTTLSALDLNPPTHEVLKFVYLRLYQNHNTILFTKNSVPDSSALIIYNFGKRFDIIINLVFLTNM